MNNLVSKFTPADEAAAQDDEGVVTIEYVLVATAVAAGVLLVFATGLWTKLNTKLTSIIP